jgi:hypothetical protein
MKKGWIFTRGIDIPLSFFKLKYFVYRGELIKVIL